MEFNSSSSGNLTYPHVDGKQDSLLTMYRIVSGLLIVAVIVGFIGNLFVAITIAMNKQFHVPIYVFLSQVSIVNAIFMAFVVPVNIYSLLYTQWSPNAVLCYIMVDMTYILQCTSGLFLSLVSAYRCALICYNNVYKILKDKRIVIGFCVLIWLESIALICGFGTNVTFSRDFMSCILVGELAQTIFTVFFYLPVILVPLVMYLKILVYVWKAKRQIQPHGETASSHYSASNKLTKMTLWVTLNHFLTGTLPGIFYMVILDDDIIRKQILLIALLCTRLMAVFDFFIYFLSNQSIRSSLVHMIINMRLQKTKQNANIQPVVAN